MKYVFKCDPRVVITKPEETCAFPSFIKFIGSFTEKSVAEFRGQLVELENLAIESGQDIIPIVIDSFGGDVYSLFSAVDAIEDLKKNFKVATVVEAKAMSAGAFLFSCGTEGYRFVSPRATVMIHDVSTGVIGKEGEIKVKASECERLNNLAFELLAKNCGKSKDYFKDLMFQNKHADLYLTPEDCVKHNIANHVAVPRFDVNVSLDTNFSW